MNILLTSAGRRTYLVRYFQKAMEAADKDSRGKVYASNSVLTPTLLQADGYVVTPVIYDGGYIDFLLDYCSKEKIDAIVSLFDIDLPVLAKNRASFEKQGTRLIVSSYGFVKICNDKYKTYSFFADHGIPTARTYISLEKAIADIDAGELKYPLIVKPRFGMGSIGVYTAENEDELRCLYNKCSREVMKTYLRYESTEYRSEAVIIQEMIVGQEYGLDIINDLNGDYINTVCKKKLAMRAGETDSAETVDMPELKQYGRSIAEAGRHIANLDCDAIIDGEGIPHFIEMNARFGGGYPFSHEAGIDLPRAIIEWLEGRDGNSFCKGEQIGVRSFKELSTFRMN